MTDTALAFLGYIGWTSLLLLSLATYRSSLTLTGKKPANSFAPSGEGISAFGLRLTRAHANCYEFFPILGGLLLFSLATGQTAITDDLAVLALGARVLQSVIHLLSTSVIAVLIRFTALLVQFAICIYWLLQFTSII
ncbi:MAG: MAPEG family protein [Robiginitomaculum sp.]|nr:MAPEG family protein [Robiginitomaculum sp.]